MMNAVQLDPLSGPNGARNIAIALCHYDGIPCSNLADHLGPSRKWINEIIARIKKTRPDMEAAHHIYKEIICKQNEEQIKESLMIDDSITTFETEALLANEDLVPTSRIMTSTEAARSAALLKAKSKKIKQLTLQIGKLKYENARLKEAVARGNDRCVCGEIGGEELITQEPDLIDEMVHLRKYDKYARRYSDRMLRFAYVLFTLSPRAYKFAKNMLLLPSRSTIFTKFSGLTKEIKRSLTDITQAHKVIEYFVDAQVIKGGKLTCCLGVDAFAFRLFLRQVASITKILNKLSPSQLEQLTPLLEDKELAMRIQNLNDEEDDEFEDVGCIADDSQLTDESISQLFDVYNSCFLYCVLPLDSEVPCFPIHLAPACHGMSTQSNMETVSQLTKICADYDIDLVYLAVDGDPGWNDKFADVTDIVGQKHRKGHIEDWALDIHKEAQEKNVHLAVGDLLHLVKRARSRYIDHMISVNVSCQDAHTNYEMVSRILKPTMALRDRSQLGRMRDYYPLELFTLQNVLTLLENDLFADALYFIPFTLLLIIVRVPFLRMDFRLKLTNLAFLLLHEMLCDVYRCGKVPQNEGDLKITPYTCAFQLTPANMRTDALGTHIVEQIIGNGRHGGDPRWERILSTFSQSTLRTVLMGMENMVVVSPGRLKTAGCTLSGGEEYFIGDFDEDLVAQVLVHGATPEGRAADDFSMNFQRVKCWLMDINAILKARENEIGRVWPPSPVANSGILARLIKSSPSACTA